MSDAMRRLSRPPRTVAVGLLTAFAMSGFLGACGDPGPETYEEDVYCATEDGTIIDEKYCDDDDGNGGGGFIWIGGFGGGYAPGQRLDSSRRTSPPIRYNDQAARSRAGLPSTGKVTGSGGLGGKVTKTRAGTGSGSKAGSSKGGGFGGSSKGGSSS